MSCSLQWWLWTVKSLKLIRLLNLLSCKEVGFLFNYPQDGSQVLTPHSRCMQIRLWHHWDSRESRSAEEILTADKKVQCSLRIFLSKRVVGFQGGKKKKKSLLNFPALIERENVRGEKKLCFLLFLFSYSFKQHNELMPPGFWFETVLCAHLLRRSFIQYLQFMAGAVLP